MEINALKVQDKINNTNWVFDTVQDMKNNSNKLKIGDNVRTLGYYTIGDNGGASYEIKNGLIANESNIISLKEDLFANFVSDNNTINVRQFGCKEDGVTDDSDNLQNLIDYAENNNYPLITGNKQNLLITKTIFIPAYLNIENIYFYTNSPTSNFRNGYMLYVNFDVLSENWKLPYPNACKGSMSYCQITNENVNNIINGIYNFGNNNYDNIQTYKLNCSFKNAVNYLDSVTLFKIYISSKIGDDFAIDLGYLGDAVKLENAHMYNTLGSSNFITTNGGHHAIDIKDIILNGAMKITGDTVSLQNIHGETQQSITITNATVSVDSLYFIHSSAPTFIISNSSVTLNGCIFNYQMRDQSFENSDDIDIQIDSFSSLIMENCYKNCRANDIAEKILFPVKVSTDTYPINNNLRNITLRTHNEMEQLPDVPTKSVSVAYAQQSDKTKWFDETNTYYYQVTPVMDFERMIRYSTYYQKTSIELENSGTGFRFASVTRGINCIIYRGLSDGNYNKRAFIGVCNGTIQDNGFLVNGIKWEDYSGDAENFNSWYNDVKYVGNNIVTIGQKPNYGNWKKGDIVYNSGTQLGADIGWLCISSGTPGTWISLGKVS